MHRLIKSAFLQRQMLRVVPHDWSPYCRRGCSVQIGHMHSQTISLERVVTLLLHREDLVLCCTLILCFNTFILMVLSVGLLSVRSPGFFGGRSSLQPPALTRVCLQVMESKMGCTDHLSDAQGHRQSAVTNTPYVKQVMMVWTPALPNRCRGVLRRRVPVHGWRGFTDEAEVRTRFPVDNIVERATRSVRPDDRDGPSSTTSPMPSDE